MMLPINPMRTIHTLYLMLIPHFIIEIQNSLQVSEGMILSLYLVEFCK